MRSVTLLPGLLLLAGFAVAASADDKPVPPKSNYKVVVKDGKTLYCRKDTDTGSRLRSTTVCLTEEEMTQLRQRTQDSMRDMTRARQGT